MKKWRPIIDVGPGLLSFGLSKTGAVVKTTEKSLKGFNDFVKKFPEAKVTEGLPKGTKWQERAGDLYQTNKVIQKGVNDSKAAIRAEGLTKAVDDELEKDKNR